VARLHRQVKHQRWNAAHPLTAPHLRSLLSYKAESAGRTLVVVNPRHTSLTCAQCGHVDQKNRVTQAVFRCCSCGQEDHADSNAAVNILRAVEPGWLRPVPGRTDPLTDSNKVSF
jgi:transposase